MTDRPEEGSATESVGARQSVGQKAPQGAWSRWPVRTRVLWTLVRRCLRDLSGKLLLVCPGLHVHANGEDRTPCTARTRSSSRSGTTTFPSIPVLPSKTRSFPCSKPMVFARPLRSSPIQRGTSAAMLEQPPGESADRGARFASGNGRGSRIRPAWFHTSQE